MREHDVQGELADGFEPSPPPIMGPDGLPERTADQPPLDDPPPRICEQGPCVHYHTFGVHFDTQQPIAGSVKKTADGQLELVGAPEPDPVRLQDHHYCYPQPGIEFVLGALPVVSCSLWEPADAFVRGELESKRERYLETARGRQYRTVLDAWKARQSALRDAEQEAIDKAAAELAEIEAERATRAETETPTETQPLATEDPTP